MGKNIKEEKFIATQPEFYDQSSGSYVYEGCSRKSLKKVKMW